MLQLLTPLLEAAAIYMVVRAARRCEAVPALRWFWLLILLTIALMTAGDLIVAGFAIAGQNRPYPSVADALYLLALPMPLAALLKVPIAGGTRTQRIRSALDVAIPVLGATAVLWYVLLGPYANDSAGATPSTIVTFSYVGGTVVLLAAVAAMLVLRCPPVLRLSLHYFAIGLGLVVVSNLVSGAGALRGVPTDTTASLLLYQLGICSLFVSASLQRPVAANDPAAAAPPPAPLADSPNTVAYVALVAAYGLLLYDSAVRDVLPPVVLVLFVMLITALVTTRQYLAQRETAQLQRRLHTVMEAVGEGIVTFTEGGLILSANRAAELAFGAAPGVLEGQSATALLADVPVPIPGDGSLVDHRRTVTGRRQNGVTFPLELLVTEAQVDGSRVFIAVGQDVSERERAQAALRESEERFRAIFDSAGVGIALTDITAPNGQRVLDVNIAFAEMFGSTIDDLLSTQLAHIRHPVENLRADVDLVEWLAWGTTPTYRLELPYLHLDGSTVLVEITISATRNEIGQAMYAISIFEDITERRRMEQHKDEFISVVGHELRTPLTSIRGSLGLLASGVVGQLPEEAAGMVDMAVTNTDRLVRLINDMLDIERMDAGRAEMVMAPTPIDDPISQSIEALRAGADAAGIVLRQEIASEIVVSADPDRVVQTLVNLIGNAVKFSEPGGTVEISATRHPEHAVITVRDRGRGIPAANLETIFDRFAQVDGSDARDKGGTGLGLPICKGIVEHHGGRIWAESAPGEGATFRFTLPLAEA